MLPAVAASILPSQGQQVGRWREAGAGLAPSCVLGLNFRENWLFLLGSEASAGSEGLEQGSPDAWTRTTGLIHQVPQRVGKLRISQCHWPLG